VILGDAAHAMAPFLGQGANQAIQDAYRLSLAVARVNEKAAMQEVGSKKLSLSEASALMKNEMNSYEQSRKLRTALIASKSGILGYLETLGGTSGMAIRNSLFFVLGKLKVVETVFVDGATQKVIS